MSERTEQPGDAIRARTIETREATISVEYGGTGPGLLLLHGFPETKYMWRDVAPRLAAEFTVVCADLRGYGESSCPPSANDHSPYSKRAMAQDMVQVMTVLGLEHFAIVGHDQSRHSHHVSGARAVERDRSARDLVRRRGRTAVALAGAR